MNAFSNPAKLASLAVITTLFIVGAIYGRVHQSKSEAPIKALGDRVVSGLLALPLMSLLLFSLVPEANKVWIILTPLPLAWYLLLLAGTDMKWSWCEKSFTKYLLSGTFCIYLTWFLVFVFL